MSNQDKINLNDHERVGIYGIVNFKRDEKQMSKWTQIGTGFQNRDGSFDLNFNYWPTNLIKIQIRPFKPKQTAEESAE